MSAPKVYLSACEWDGAAQSIGENHRLLTEAVALGHPAYKLTKKGPNIQES